MAVYKCQHSKGGFCSMSTKASYAHRKNWETNLLQNFEFMIIQIFNFILI